MKHRAIPVPEPLFVVIAAILAFAFCGVIYQDIELSLWGRVEVGIVTEYVPETSLSRKRRLSRVAHFYRIKVAEKTLHIDLKKEGLQSKSVWVIYLPNDPTVASYYSGSRDVFSLVWWQFGALALVPAVAGLLTVYSAFGFIRNSQISKRRDIEIARFAQAEADSAEKETKSEPPL